MNAAIEEDELSAACPCRTLPPGKTRYPFYRRLGWPQGWTWRAENLAPTGIRSRTVQPVVSRYTDWATGPTYSGYTCIIFFFVLKFCICSLISYRIVKIKKIGVCVRTEKGILFLLGLEFVNFFPADIRLGELVWRCMDETTCYVEWPRRYRTETCNVLRLEQEGMNFW